jgi:hypothetical protein
LATGWGPPSKDSGVVGSKNSSYGVCPGTKLRALEYGSGALVVLFGDVGGAALTLYGWSLSDTGKPEQVPRARALIGETTAFEFGIGTTVAQAQSRAADAFTVRPAESPGAASFALKDESAGFTGSLTGTDPGSTMTSVHAGRACRE